MPEGCGRSYGQFWVRSPIKGGPRQATYFAYGSKKSAHKPWEIEDGLWNRVKPLLPVVERNSWRPGRKRLDDRKVLRGILFVLYTGIRWEFLPQELGFGSGLTCWRRLRYWNDVGVWQRLHELLLAELRARACWTSPARRSTARTCAR